MGVVSAGAGGLGVKGVVGICGCMFYSEVFTSIPNWSINESHWRQEKNHQIPHMRSSHFLCAKLQNKVMISGLSKLHLTRFPLLF